MQQAHILYTSVAELLCVLHRCTPQPAFDSMLTGFYSPPFDSNINSLDFKYFQTRLLIRPFSTSVPSMLAFPLAMFFLNSQLVL